MPVSSKQKKNLAVILISIIFLSLLLAAGFAVFLWFLITGGKADIKTGAVQYGRFEDFYGYSNLYIFPERLSDSANNVDYYYYCRDTFLDPTCQVYLSCEYNQEDYQTEIERLSSIQENYRGRTNQIRYDLQNYEYPAYVTIDNFNFCYEYALVIEEHHQIVYVFTQFIKKKDVHFSQAYLPDEFMVRLDSPLDGFSLYAFNNEDSSAYFTTY